MRTTSMSCWLPATMRLLERGSTVTVRPIRGGAFARLAGEREQRPGGRRRGAGKVAPGPPAVVVPVRAPKRVARVFEMTWASARFSVMMLIEARVAAGTSSLLDQRQQ